MNHSVQTVLVAASVAAFALLGCNKEKSPAATAQTTGAGSSDVVATYAGKSLTMAELDQRISDELFQTRRNALEQIVLEDLVKMEAEKRGMTEEQLLKEEIEKKVPPPSDEQIAQFWEQVKAQLPPDAKLEDYRERIVGQLTRPQQQERAREYFTELRNNAKVEIKLAQPLPPKKEVEATGPSKGPKDAPITIVEFSDFQCPFCGRAASTVDQVLEAYPGKIQLFFRHFPLDFHKQAPKASEAAMCAGEQNKFWEYHDVLFKNQDKLMPEDLTRHAEGLGLDSAKFNECLNSNKYAATVQKDLEAGKKLGVTGTPAFFINGRMISGAQPIEEFKRVIDTELGEKK